jgi:hypothetical protein
MSGDSNVILAGKDGYLRRFLTSAADDDGTPIASELLLGPFHVPRAEGVDGMVTEIVGALAMGSGTVTWSIVTGSSAEQAVDRAVAIMDGSNEDEVDATGDWTAGQNGVEYPRARGPWAVLWLSSAEQWAYEAATLWMTRLGRLRNG